MIIDHKIIIDNFILMLDTLVNELVLYLYEQYNIILHVSTLELMTLKLLKAK